MSQELTGHQMFEVIKKGEAEVQALAAAFLGISTLDSKEEMENIDQDRFVYLTSHDNLYFAILDKDTGIALIDALHPVSGRRINKPKAMESLQSQIVGVCTEAGKEVELIINLDRLGVKLFDTDNFFFRQSMLELFAMMAAISKYKILGDEREYKIVIQGAAIFNKYIVGSNESKLEYAGQGLNGLHNALNT